MGMAGPARVALVRKPHRQKPQDLAAPRQIAARQGPRIPREQSGPAEMQRRSCRGRIVHGLLVQRQVGNVPQPRSVDHDREHLLRVTPIPILHDRPDIERHMVGQP